MNTELATKIANEKLEILRPYCDVINIAGSIRREKHPEVKDIEIVCLPKVNGAVIQGSLFGDPKIVQPHNPIDEFRQQVMKLGYVGKGKTDGRQMQIFLPEGITLDLFMPQRDDYYRQYAIRTGSGDYSTQVIARGWRSVGWVGTHDGLRRSQDCERRDDNSWVVVNENYEIPPVWSSEEEFFDFINVQWIPPQHRKIVYS